MEIPNIRSPEISNLSPNNPEIPSTASGSGVEVDAISVEIARNDNPFQAEIKVLSAVEDPSDLDKALNVPKAGAKISDPKVVALEDAANQLLNKIS